MIYSEPNTCEDTFHVSNHGAKRCHCGERRNPSYRNWWQRYLDRKTFRKYRRTHGGGL